MTLRPRPRYSTRAWPKATGTTATTPGMRTSASASSMVRWCVVPPNAPGTPPVSTFPGWIAMRFVPNCENWPTTYCRAPSPTEVSTITEHTPIAMPTSESAERRRWATSARQASRTRSATSAPRGERAHRIEPRRLARRPEPEDDADGRRQPERRRDGPRRRGRRERRVEPHEGPRAEPAEAEAEDAAGRREQRGLGDEHGEHLSPRHAEGAEQPHLGRPLRHRDEHHVHDAGASHAERHRGDRRERQRERAHDAGERVEDGVGRQHGHVLLAVPLAQQRDHLGLLRTDVLVALELDEQPEERAAVEEPHGRRDGHDDHLVQIHPHVRATRSQDADHAGPETGHADHAPEWILGREELAGDCRADDGDGRRALER